MGGGDPKHSDFFCVIRMFRLSPVMGVVGGGRGSWSSDVSFQMELSSGPTKGVCDQSHQLGEDQVQRGGRSCRTLNCCKHLPGSVPVFTFSRYTSTFLSFPAPASTALRFSPCPSLNLALSPLRVGMWLSSIFIYFYFFTGNENILLLTASVAGCSSCHSPCWPDSSVPGPQEPCGLVAIAPPEEKGGNTA